MSTPRRLLLYLLTLLCVVAAGGAAGADTIAFTLQSEFTTPSLTPTTDGFLFRPTNAIAATRLGYYDEFQDGLVLDHPVGIFDGLTQQLLVQTTVGPGSTLDGLFRFNTVPRVLLQANHPYVLAGFHPGGAEDAIAISQVGGALDAGVTPSPLLGYQGYLFDFGAGLTFPTTGPDTTFFAFGPNAAFDVVPEPSSILLIVLGLAGLTGWRWWGRRQAG